MAYSKLKKSEIKLKYETVVITSNKMPSTVITPAETIKGYICEGGHLTVYSFKDSGLAPPNPKCQQCNKEAKALIVTPSSNKPTMEWYRPTLQETYNLRRKPILLDYVLAGGLLWRKIPKKLYTLKSH